MICENYLVVIRIYNRSYILIRLEIKLAENLPERDTSPLDEEATIVHAPTVHRKRDLLQPESPGDTVTLSSEF